MANVTNLPENVSFNLDAIERPENEVKEPFTVRVADRVITMKDPAEFDWRDLIDITHPDDFLVHCLEDDDRYFLQDQKIPAWKFNDLLEAYMRHYGIDPKKFAAGRR